MTGVVINAAFNENERVVCKLGEALDCVQRTKVDVLGDRYLERREKEI